MAEVVASDGGTGAEGWGDGAAGEDRRVEGEEEWVQVEEDEDEEEEEMEEEEEASRRVSAVRVMYAIGSAVATAPPALIADYFSERVKATGVASFLSLLITSAVLCVVYAVGLVLTGMVMQAVLARYMHKLRVRLGNALIHESANQRKIHPAIGDHLGVLEMAMRAVLLRLPQIIGVVGAIATLATVAWDVALAFGMVALIIVLCMRPVREILGISLQNQLAAQHSFAPVFLNTLRGLDVIAEHLAHSWALQRLDPHIQALADARSAKLYWSAAVLTWAYGLVWGTMAAAVSFVALRVVSGETSAGEFAAIVYVVRTATQPVYELSDIFVRSMTASPAFIALEEILEESTFEPDLDESSSGGEGGGGVVVVGGDGVVEGTNVAHVKSDPQIHSSRLPPSRPPQSPSKPSTSGIAAGGDGRAMTKASSMSQAVLSSHLRPPVVEKSKLKRSPTLPKAAFWTRSTTTQSGDGSLEPSVDDSGKKEIPHVWIDGVTARYGGSGRPALRNVSISLEQGEQLSLVGSSGSGKTSILRLLMGTLRPETGHVRVNGHHVRSMKHSAQRLRIGVVFAESFLFAGTIRDNIQMGRPGSFEDVISAARLAGMHSEVQKFPHKYDSVIAEAETAGSAVQIAKTMSSIAQEFGEEIGSFGCILRKETDQKKVVTLSSGMIRRLILARTLFSRPNLLLLDEPVAGMNPSTAQAIMSTIALAARRGRISIIHVVHDLTILEGHVGKILVLQGGKIVQSGSYTELSEDRGSMFAELMHHSTKIRRARTLRNLRAMAKIAAIATASGVPSAAGGASGAKKPLLLSNALSAMGHSMKATPKAAASDPHMTAGGMFALAKAAALMHHSAAPVPSPPSLLNLHSRMMSAMGEGPSGFKAKTPFAMRRITTAYNVMPSFAHDGDHEWFEHIEMWLAPPSYPSLCCGGGDVGDVGRDTTAKVAPEQPPPPPSSSSSSSRTSLSPPPAPNNQHSTATNNRELASKLSSDMADSRGRAALLSWWQFLVIMVTRLATETKWYMFFPILLINATRGIGDLVLSQFVVVLLEGDRDESAVNSLLVPFALYSALYVVAVVVQDTWHSYVLSHAIAHFEHEVLAGLLMLDPTEARLLARSFVRDMTAVTSFTWDVLLIWNLAIFRTASLVALLAWDIPSLAIAYSVTALLVFYLTLQLTMRAARTLKARGPHDQAALSILFECDHAAEILQSTGAMAWAEKRVKYTSECVMKAAEAADSAVTIASDLPYSIAWTIHAACVLYMMVLVYRNEMERSRFVGLAVVFRFAAAVPIFVARIMERSLRGAAPLGRLTVIGDLGRLMLQWHKRVHSNEEVEGDPVPQAHFFPSTTTSAAADAGTTPTDGIATPLEGDGVSKMEPHHEGEGHVELRHIVVRPVHGAPAVLRDFCLSVRRGEQVALVGQSGTGKSTVLRTILGQLLPESGDVFIGGKSILDTPHATLMSILGVVQQEGFLFAGSIAANIAVGRPGTMEDVMRAARLAGADADIKTFPNGYHTFVAQEGIVAAEAAAGVVMEAALNAGFDDDGVEDEPDMDISEATMRATLKKVGIAELSRGQQQRICVARALFLKPSVLLLDDAAASLDPVSALDLFRTLHRVCTYKRISAIHVTHNVDLLAQVDRICVLGHGGEILEHGTYDSLMEAEGRFFRMVQRRRGGWTTVRSRMSVLTALRAAHTTDSNPFSHNNEHVHSMHDHSGHDSIDHDHESSDHDHESNDHDDDDDDGEEKMGEGGGEEEEEGDGKEDLSEYVP